MAYTQDKNPFKNKQVKISGESTSAIYSIGKKKYVDVTEGSYKGASFRIPSGAKTTEGHLIGGSYEFKRGRLRLVK